MSDPQPSGSGRDLARQALAAYKASRPAGPAAARPVRPRRTRAEGGTGRDPVGFGELLGRLKAEQGWATAVRGGSILDRFDELCPQYTGCVQAVAFHADRGRLDVRPGSDAYAAQLRLLGSQLCRQINDKLGTDTVRSLGVLPVGRIDIPRSRPAASDEAAAAEPGPVRTRDTASDGYRCAVAAHRKHARTPEDDTPLAERIAAARARQDAALLANRPSDTEHAAFRDERERLAEDQPASTIEVSIKAALAYKHYGAPGWEPRTAFKAA
ncbi:DciA family protein [Streptomyces sp. NPDC050848]|uniref:DciA family protein n=1 Tax=Streptomyces sp. NPDC050848 TaxID=3155791 RepID=UPI00340FB808